MSVVAGLVAVGANGALLGYWMHRRGTRIPVGTNDVSVAPDFSTPLLLRECAPVSVWAIATFAIYGGTSTISSVVDLKQFAVYSVAVGISLLLLGLHSAAFSTLIPHVAHIRQARGMMALVPAIHHAAILSAVISLTALLGMLAAGKVVLHVLVPTMPTDVLVSLVLALFIGNAVRLVGLPYANALVGLGAQGRLIATPVIEAAVTVGAALRLGLRFGAFGVAWSICVGGLASLLMHYFINVRATHDLLPISRNRVVLVPLLIIGGGGLFAFWITGG
jgi:O-antigen/teichoic acid export membrane protein